MLDNFRHTYTSRDLSKVIQGDHSYDILQNPTYQQLLQYEPSYHSNAEHFDIDNQDLNDQLKKQRTHNGDVEVDYANNYVQTDLIRLVLYLSFMSIEEQKSFRFST